MIIPKNLIKHELIGLDINVQNSTNKSLNKIKGKVVDETKNMLKIKTKGSVKSVQKKSATFIFTLPDKRKVKISGDIIEKRPEDRIKLKLKKW